MKFYTKASNMTQFLVKVYKVRGRKTFLEELTKYATSTTEDVRDIKETGRIISFLALQILSNILTRRQEEIMTIVFDISDKLKKIKDKKKAIAFFVDEIDRQILEIEYDSNRISDKVLKYLKECTVNEIKQITVEGLADHFMYSKFHFSRKFNKEMEYTLHDAILYEKMNRAFKILRDEHTTVKDVSEVFGFSDPQYFTKVFKKLFGITPSSLLKIEHDFEQPVV